MIDIVANVLLIILTWLTLSLHHDSPSSSHNQHDEQHHLRYGSIDAVALVAAGSSTWPALRVGWAEFLGLILDLSQKIHL